MRNVVIALFAAAGLATPVFGQATLRYDWQWVEVNAGTNTPVANPNGSLDAGEAARITLTITMTPGPGSPVTYMPPPPPGVGTLAGLALGHFDLIASANAGPVGHWSSIGRGAGWIQPFAPTAMGNDLLDASVGQALDGGVVVNSTNPVVNVWRGVWTPASYTPRVVTFSSRGAASAPGEHSAVAILYGFDPNGNPLYVQAYVDGVFGSVLIPFGLAAQCYANCDGSTAVPVLNVNDFQCFLNRYAAGDPYANCDGSTAAPVLNINDFQCFLNQFAVGCP